MDQFIRRASERLASQASRRRFFAVLGKLALSAAAVAAGQGLFANGAEAAGGVPLHCCSGHACPHDGCPAGTAVKYTWSCGHYFCHDCFHAVRRGRYVCTSTIHKLVKRHR